MELHVMNKKINKRNKFYAWQCSLNSKLKIEIE